MDAAVFEQVYGAFQDFHAYFAPLFGRRETRDHSRHYLQALLVQSGERRNAENLSETVPASARVMKRFLAESPWDDDTVIGLPSTKSTWDPDWGTLRGCGCWTAATSPTGQEVSGSDPSVLRETGQGGQLPGRNVPGLYQPVGAALVDKGLYLPESWTSDKDRCAAAGAFRTRRSWAGLPVEDPIGAGYGGAGLGAGSSEGWLGCRGRRFRDVAVIPRGTGRLGDTVRPGRSGGLYGVAA